MRPKYLRRNDKIALAAPARKITPAEVDFAVKTFKSWGLEVIVDEKLFRSDNQFGGTDEERLSHFQSLLDDDNIKAIVCVRGGYGVTRIVDRIDFTKFNNKPKWICGYSDVTALLSHINSLGIEGIHSTMPLLFERDSTESLESLRKLLFGEPYSIDASIHPLNRLGKSQGVVLGGNLSILNTIIATASDIDTNNSILFLEDIDEYLYNIDRMMVHLKRSGKLTGIKGLIVGHMTDMKDNTIPFGRSAYEIIDFWTRDLKIPVCYGFPLGHEPVNLAIPCGRPCELDVQKDKVTLRFN